MDKVGIFSFGRKQSQRCPNKMLRPFAGTTLTDIVLSKLAVFGSSAFFAAYEKEFEDKTRLHGINFVKRDEKSVHIDEPITEILGFLREVEFEYLLIVSGCLPFLRVDTMHDFLDKCVKAGYKPTFSVAMRRSFYINAEHKPLNFDYEIKTINTKNVEPVYEAVHALYFFNKDYFFRNGRYWDWREVRFVEVSDKIETLDIDTEEDFRIAEEIFKIRQKEI